MNFSFFWNKVYQTELSLNSNFFQKLILQTQFCLANLLKPRKVNLKFGKRLF